MNTSSAATTIGNNDIAGRAQSVWIRRGLTTARYLLGALLVFSVANAVFNFAAQPPLPASAQTFMGGLFSAPYFFALLKGTELLVALALLANRFVPLALVVLAPITVNIVLFHLVLAPAGTPVAIVLLGLHAVGAWAHRKSYRSLLVAR